MHSCIRIQHLQYAEFELVGLIELECTGISRGGRRNKSRTFLSHAYISLRPDPHKPPPQSRPAALLNVYSMEEPSSSRVINHDRILIEKSLSRYPVKFYRPRLGYSFNLGHKSQLSVKVLPTIPLVCVCVESTRCRLGTTRTREQSISELFCFGADCHHCESCNGPFGLHKDTSSSPGAPWQALDRTRACVFDILTIEHSISTTQAHLVLLEANHSARTHPT